MTKATNDLFADVFNTPFFKSTVGFDRLFNDVVNRNTLSHKTSYPPYNIKKLTTENSSYSTYEIELAVAGFKRDDLDVEVNRGKLTITGQVSHSGDATTVEFIHHGIAQRSFTHTFKLADDVEVTDVRLVDGLLTIRLEQIVPEELQPKKIEIK